MRPRIIVRMGNLEKRSLVLTYYQRHGGLWDVMANEIGREPQFGQLSENVKDLYNNVTRRNVVRRRMQDYNSERTKTFMSVLLTLSNFQVKTCW